MNRTAKEEGRAILRDIASLRVTLAYLLGTMGLTILVQQFVPDVFMAMMSMDQGVIMEAMNWGNGLGLFLTVLVTLFCWVMNFGYAQWALRVARGSNPPVSSLIEGFGITGKVIFLQIFRCIFMYLWSLCFLFSMMIPIFMVLLLFGGNVTMMYALAPIVTIVVAVLLVGIFLWLSVRYCFVSFALADNPSGGAWGAMQRGVALQRNQFRKVLKFYLSFWRWGLFYAFTVMFYAGVLNPLCNYMMNPVADLSEEALFLLLEASNPVAYWISSGIDVVFLLKFFPLYYVSLGVLYEGMRKEAPLEERGNTL